MANATSEVAARISDAVNGLKDVTTYTVPSQIGGKEVYFSDTFDVINPSTGTLLHHCSSASVGDAIKAVNAAHAAFPAWRDTPPNKKRDIFLKTAEVLQRRAQELGKYMEEETGAGNFWSEQFNIPVAVDQMKDLAGRISGIVGTSPAINDPGRSAIIVREPYGVILGIAPWNAAYILGFRAVTYAMAAGNTAVLKASEISPRCSWAIADCFREGGLPDGVLNVIAHSPANAAAVTKSLIENPLVKKINFTGSTAVGRIIAETAGRNLKPVLLELGGKAPAIVWEDADLKLAASECANGTFWHHGQICMSTERLIVHKNVASEFETEFKAVVKERYPGALVLFNKTSVEKNHRLVRDAISKGAVLVLGEVGKKESTDTRMAPIIVKGVTKEMDLYYTESFGPTVSLIIIETEEEALRIANDTEYGLSSAIFTEDLRRGLRMAKAIESGACHINGMTVHDEAALPHGGMKNSGFGRFGSGGLDEWFRTKTITFKN